MAFGRVCYQKVSTWGPQRRSRRIGGLVQKKKMASAAVSQSAPALKVDDSPDEIILLMSIQHISV